MYVRTKPSARSPYWFNPCVHSLNVRGAKISPHVTPAATCGTVWCPSDILDHAMMPASGMTTSGGIMRIRGDEGKAGCIGKYAHARVMYVAK